MGSVVVQTQMGRSEGVILSRKDGEVTLVVATGDVERFREDDVTLHHVAEDTPAYGMIATASRQQVNKINGYIVNRRQHPSYGYTKAMIRDGYHHLMGLGHALALVTDQGTTDSAGAFALNRLVGEDTMRDLHARVRDC
jgi:hypothetical protein